MPSNHLIGFDGTWQSADQADETNILSLCWKAEMMEGQSIRYYPGVGTDWRRFSGGLFGAGLADQVINAYAWLMRHYLPGDHIYIIGFSRGAYQARKLAGMLGRVGLASNGADSQSCAKTAWTVNNEYDPTHAASFRQQYRAGITPVRFLGVFDTVGAHGIPVGATRLLAPRFRDNILGDNVQTARHCVSRDEQRVPFSPTLWDNRTHPDMEQLVFPGWHSDIGGTGSKGLGDITLLYMAKELAAAGLILKRNWADDIYPDPGDEPKPPRLRWFTRRRPRVFPPHIPFHVSAVHVGGGA
jgi:uncharacterized protein (DUF2235 family)